MIGEVRVVKLTLNRKALSLKFDYTTHDIDDWAFDLSQFQSFARLEDGFKTSNADFRSRSDSCGWRSHEWDGCGTRPEWGTYIGLGPQTEKKTNLGEYASDYYEFGTIKTSFIKNDTGYRDPPISYFEMQHFLAPVY
ncbi:hypothetical protein EVAR_79848_1 [Eumeta japonica]|uniref:Uncharacterized protein n=1 Tax=Eumeta variegata TaxID=151549 RepID=A0A4C1TYW7_EUMVA|nr:hypothetical protein EVAR_79848_1 [Eumeta japonica]